MLVLKKTLTVKSLLAVAVLLAGVCAPVYTDGNHAQAAINGKRAAVLSPFAGNVPWGLSGATHAAEPSGSVYGFAWDLRGTDATVYPRVATGDGTLTMKVSGNPVDNGNDSGKRVLIEVKVGGTTVGKVRYVHLKDVPGTIIDGATVTTSTPLGKTAADRCLNSNNQEVVCNSSLCHGYRCSAYWDVHSQPGIHTHVDFSQGCYRSVADNSSADASTGLVLLSSNYGGTNKSSCDTNELDTVAAGTGGSGTVLGDFNKDGLTDPTIFRPSTGEWQTKYSNGTYANTYFGHSGEIPVPGDYNGDGWIERATFRPNDQNWDLMGVGFYQLGLPGDIPAPADFDHDGSMDMTIFRPSTGEWQTLYRSGLRANTYWGGQGDIPLPGDYNGDGWVERAYLHPSDMTWHIMGVGTYQLGLSGDIPVPADFDGNGSMDMTIFRPSTGEWQTLYMTGMYANTYWGQSGDIPVPGYYDGTKYARRAYLHTSDMTWHVLGDTATTTQLGIPGDVPAVSALNAVLLGQFGLL